MALLKILSKLGGVFTWALDLIIKNWKVVFVLIGLGYAALLKVSNNSLKIENLSLSNTVFKQDSLITVQKSRLYQDSVVYVSQIHDLQLLVKETSDNNKKTLKENQDLRSVILGNKCLKSGLFGKKINITNCN